MMLGSSCVLVVFIALCHQEPNANSKPEALDLSVKNPQKISGTIPPEGPRRTKALENGKRLFVEQGCWQCHNLDNDAMPPGRDFANIGPDLTWAADRLSRAQFIESIVAPNAVIAEPKEKYAVGKASKMPSYADQLRKEDLLDLVIFLSSQKRRNN